MIKELFPYECADSVFDIDYQKLYQMGYRGLIFDIDNTLVHHGADSTPEVDALFEQVRSMGFRTVLLTDNGESRVKRFIQNIDTPYVCDANKPDSAALRQSLRLLGVEKGQAVCIGDQIFTDILGANRSGIASILVKFIRLDSERGIGKRRYLEYLILFFYRHSGMANRLGGIGKRKEIQELRKRGGLARFLRGEILFSEVSPMCYRFSVEKEILKRHVRDLLSGQRYAREKSADKLPCVVFAHHSELIKRGKGIDPVLQENKAVNIDLAGKKLNGLIIRPGEIFSFWQCVGRTTKRGGYKPGRIIEGGSLKPGLGGGLCNLGNTVHLLALHSPLDVIEVHYHSDALAPDFGKRVPFSSGTSVSYNYLDLRFQNNTDQSFQLSVWCSDMRLYAELRSEREIPWRYELTEEGHHFRREGERYYRISKIYRNTIDTETGELLKKELIRDNHSEVMFDYDLIPAELLHE